MIYKKIKKANLLRKTAFEAAQAGAQGTGIDFDKEEGDGPKKVANPITNTSSPFKDTDPKKKVEKKIVSADPDGDGIYTAQDYIKTMINNPSSNITIPGFSGSANFKSAFGDAKKAGLSEFEFGGKKYSTALSKDPNFGKDKTIQVGGGSSANVSLTPRKKVEKTDPSQQYNMSFKNVENANWAKNSMRRGLNRDERKDIKNTVQKMRTLDPTAAEEYKKSMKKSRKDTFLGLGIGGDRQERKIQALKDAGKLDKDYQSIKSEIADTNLQMGTEERKQKIESATMNKYNMALDDFGDPKPGTSKTVDESGEGYEVYDGPVGDIDTSTGTGTNIFSDFMKNKTFGGSLMSGFSSGLFPKSKLGKNAKAFKNKSGRGAGY